MIIQTALDALSARCQQVQQDRQSWQQRRALAWSQALTSTEVEPPHFSFFSLERLDHTSVIAYYLLSVEDGARPDRLDYIVKHGCLAYRDAGERWAYGCTVLKCDTSFHPDEWRLPGERPWLNPPQRPTRGRKNLPLRPRWRSRSTSTAWNAS